MTNPTLVRGKNPAYSLAATGGGLIFLSGHVGSDEQGGGADAPFGTQVRRAIGRLQDTLERAGTGVAALVKINVYLADKEYFEEFNRIYCELIPSPRPPRTTIEAPLGHGWLFEIDGVALAPRSQCSPE